MKRIALMILYIFSGLFSFAVELTLNSNTIISQSGSTLWDNESVYSNGNNITIKEGKTLIVNGDLYLDDNTYVALENSATLYVKGSIIVNGGNANIAISKSANVIAEKTINSNSGTLSVYVPKPREYNNNTAPDIYALQGSSGNISIKSSSNMDIADIINLIISSILGSSTNITIENTLDNNDIQLQSTVNNILNSTSSCVINIPNNATVVVPEGAEVDVCSITMGENSKFVNWGVINVTGDGLLDLKSCYKSGASFDNNGIINATKIILSQDISYNHIPEKFKFNNSGIINSNIFDFCIGQYVDFGTSCSSIINTKRTKLFLNGGYTPIINGDIISDYLEIFRQSQDNIEFGSNCGSSIVNVDTLKINGCNWNILIKELVGCEELIMDGSANVKVDGQFILGETVGTTPHNFSITGTENSTITLCYNKTKNGDRYGNSSGTVIYLTEYGLTDEEKIHLADGDRLHVWDNNTKPETEHAENSNDYDITLYNDGKSKASQSTYQECLDNQSKILPVELTSFSIYNNIMSWTTASETNNNKFVVEYSSNGYDWNDLVEVDGFGTTSESHNYMISVYETGYYRLKQIDFDNTCTYSTIKYYIINSRCDFDSLMYNNLKILYNQYEKRAIINK